MLVAWSSSAFRETTQEVVAHMKQIFVIGGMGSGKSTATKALVEQGLAHIDLDKVGHDILKWEVVKEDLSEAFGDDIFDDSGEVVRAKLAAKAFASPADTRKLNRITMPRIEEAFTEQIDDLEAKGTEAVVVEYSVFRNRETSLAYGADVVLAVLAPVDLRIERAVASGFDEDDVRQRIARQITDADRVEAADVVFNNDSSREELYNQVLSWWSDYAKQ